MSEEFWLAVAAPSMLLVSLFSDWLKRHSVNAEAYCMVERRRAIQWGVHADRPYLFIELPSWDWRRDILRDQWCWHRRVLVWTDGRGWMLWYRPEALAA